MRKRVLIFTDWFVPAYKAGGPVKSVFNLITALADDYDFAVVCGDRDLQDNEAFEDIALNTWIRKGGFDVIYLSREHQKLSKYKAIIKEKSPDWLYFNSLFSVRFTLLPLLAHKRMSSDGRQILLAPRGMLGVGALQLKKQKKALFLLLSKAIGLFKNITWHATSLIEQQEIRAYFPEATCRVAENLSGLIQEEGIHIGNQKRIGEVNLFFLSRISPKKNLTYALSALLALDAECKIKFSIYGPIEDDAYWSICKGLMTELAHKGNVECFYHGSIPNHLLAEALSNQHFLFLPTRNENYGHVIVESWLAGCPVIISDQTPWQKLEEKKLGWALDLHDQNVFKKVLFEVCQMDHMTFTEWSASARSYGAKVAMNEEVINRSRQLFL